MTSESIYSLRIVYFEFSANIVTHTEYTKERNSHEKDMSRGTAFSYQTVCAPSEDLDQPMHPRSLIRDFAGCLVGLQ